jgi:hypothetical protein
METLKQFETLLDKYLGEMAPALPNDIKEFLAKVLPWLTLIGVIFMVPIVLLFFGIGSVALPFAAYSGAYYGESGIGYLWALVLMLVSIASVALNICSLPGLFNRQLSGWNFLFYATTLGLLVNILHLSVFSVIWSIFVLYVVIQIKSSYK